MKLVARYFLIVSVRAKDKSQVPAYFNSLYDTIE